MNLKKRLNSLAELGKHLTPENEQLQAIVRRTAFHNAWFTEDNQWKAIGEIRTHFLNITKLNNWLKPYNANQRLATRETPITESPNYQKTVALVLAGNIPLVGFHDILCVFVAGHKALIKLSEKDPYLLPFILKTLNEIDTETTVYFDISEGAMKGFDAVIATGSNNSARYFEAYFGKHPHIIRKNRNAIAILLHRSPDGKGGETRSDFKNLGKDIFTYFGLGCRNVSKLYVPRGYNFHPLLTVLHTFKDLVLHDKYKNNFDYNFTLLILNKISYEGNGCILMTENTGIASPIAALYYEFYDNFEDLSIQLLGRKEEIQCVVSKDKIEGLPCFTFGAAQKPGLEDYADGVDVLGFLLGL